MARIPNKRSPLDDAALNIDNRVIDTVNGLSEAIRNLTVNGQLTPRQFAELIEVIDGLISKGNVSVNDININLGRIGLEHLSEDVKKAMSGNTPILSEVADGAITTPKLAPKAVDSDKLSDNLRRSIVLNQQDIEWKSGTLSNGVETQSELRLVSDYIAIDGAELITLTSTAMSFVAVYDAYTKEFTHTISSASMSKSITEPCFVRIVIGYSNNRTITDSNKPTLINMFNMLLKVKPSSKTKSFDLSKDVKSFLGYKDLTGLDFSWEIGGISSSTGEPGTTVNHLIRTTSFIKLQRGTEFNVPTNMSMMIYRYTPKGDFIDRILYTDHFVIDDNHLIKLALGYGRINNTPLVNSDVRDLSEKLTVSTPTEWKLENLSNEISGFFNKVTKNGRQFSWEIGSLLRTDGSLGTESKNRIRSNFIEVNKTTVITNDEYDFMVYMYDSNNNYISNNDSTWFDGYFESNINGYVKLLIRYPDNRDLTSSDIPVLYSTINIAQTEIEGVNTNGGSSPRNNGYMLSDDISGLYDSPSIENFNNINGMQTNEVYALYDDLMSRFGDYIVKRDNLGTVSGQNIYVYTLRPHTLDSNVTIRLPKIMMNSGLHGNEKNQVIALYNFVKKLCESWRDDKFLEFFRYNIEFEIMPVANPIGFNRNIRQNGNGIDLNRNFPTNLEITDDLQEETKIIMKYLQSAGSSDLFINLHRMFFRDGYMAYVLTNDDGLSLVSNRAIQQISRKWQKEYDFFPQSDTHKFGYTARTLNSTLNGHAMLYGHRSVTLEHVEEIQWQENWSRYDDLTIMTGEELLINYLKILLKEIVY